MWLIRCLVTRKFLARRNAPYQYTDNALSARRFASRAAALMMCVDGEHPVHLEQTW